MNLKHKNITFSFIELWNETDHIDNKNDMLDSYVAYYKLEDLQYVIKFHLKQTIGQLITEGGNVVADSDDLTYCFEDIIQDYYDDDSTKLELDQYIDAYIKSNPEEKVPVHNIYTNIILFNMMIKYYKVSSGHKTYDIEIEGHPYWILHDIKHSEKDVSELFEITLDKHIEANRILEGFKYLQHFGLGHLFTCKMYHEITKSYLNKFDEPLVIDYIENEINYLDYYE